MDCILLALIFCKLSFVDEQPVLIMGHGSDANFVSESDRLLPDFGASKRLLQCMTDVCMRKPYCTVKDASINSEI